MSDQKNGRREPRTNRVVHVHWLNRERDAEPAEVLDASSGGLFIVPSGALPESIGQGDRAWIVVSRPDGETTLSGIVRWRGYSQTHDAIGFGIELDTGSRDLVGKAFAL